jgi:uncharacterized protein (DUF433 family)
MHERVVPGRNRRRRGVPAWLSINRQCEFPRATCPTIWSSEPTSRIRTGPFGPQPKGCGDIHGSSYGRRCLINNRPIGYLGRPRGDQHADEDRRPLRLRRRVARTHSALPPPSICAPASSSDRLISFAKCGGRPCIRGMRVRVTDILAMLSEGASHEEILRDLPYLEADDIKAVLAYAARQSDHTVLQRS